MIATQPGGPHEHSAIGSSSLPELRAWALGPLTCSDVLLKAHTVLSRTVVGPLDTRWRATSPAGVTLPGRPDKPQLVDHRHLWSGSMQTTKGRAALVHAIAHIELNAIDLALDIIWRFDRLPADFYADWLQVAREEAKHFLLLQEHLQSMGYQYGDFDAHNALWAMADRTRDDVLARLALVPRTLEARGLDATPAVKGKLVGAGDVRAGEILDIILSDEIGHVSIGNRWYRYVCVQRGLDPIEAEGALIQSYQAPRQRGPFNLRARQAAGFTDEELRHLQERASLPKRLHPL